MSGDDEAIVHLARRPMRLRKDAARPESGMDFEKVSSSSSDGLEMSRPSSMAGLGRAEGCGKGYGAEFSRPSSTAGLGLLLHPDVLKSPDDFGGNEVKPRSLVGSSTLTMMYSPVPGVPAGPAKTGTREWLDLRQGYLVEKETQLRSLHIEAGTALLSLIELISAQADAVALRGPHALFSLIQQIQRVYASLNKTVLPLQAVRMPAIFLPDVWPPPERDDHTFEGELIEPWQAQTMESLKKTMQALKQRVQYFSDVVKDVVEEAQSGHDTDGDEARTTWIENKQANVFVRKADPKACSSLLDSIQYCNDAVKGLGMFNFSPARTASGEGSEGVVGCAVMSYSKMLVPDSWAIVCKTPLFKGSVDGAEIMHEIASKLRPMLFAPNALVIKKGTVGRAMYFINSGSCKVSVNGATVAHRRAGDFLGEIALIVSEERMADVETEGSVELFELRRSEFHEIIRRFPHIYKRIAAVATVRVKEGHMAESLDEEGKGKMVREEDLRACDMDEVCNFNMGTMMELPPAPHGHISKMSKSELEEAHYLTGAAVECIHEECLREMKASLLKDDDYKQPDHLVQWSQIILNITNSSRRVELAPDSEVLRQGEFGIYLYIVEKGSCVYCNTSEVMRVGCVFGQIALISSCTRESAVRAGGEGATVLQMCRHDIVHLLDEVPLFEDLLEGLSTNTRIPPPPQPR